MRTTPFDVSKVDGGPTEWVNLQIKSNVAATGRGVGSIAVRARGPAAALLAPLNRSRHLLR